MTRTQRPAASAVVFALAMASFALCAHRPELAAGKARQRVYINNMQFRLAVPFHYPLEWGQQGIEPDIEVGLLLDLPGYPLSYALPVLQPAAGTDPLPLPVAAPLRHMLHQQHAAFPVADHGTDRHRYVTH